MKQQEKTPKKQIEKNETLKLIQNDNAQFFEIMTPDGEKSGSFLTNQVTLFLVKIFYWLEALQNCWLLVIAEAYYILEWSSQVEEIPRRRNARFGRNWNDFACRLRPVSFQMVEKQCY